MIFGFDKTAINGIIDATPIVSIKAVANLSISKIRADLRSFGDKKYPNLPKDLNFVFLLKSLIPIFEIFNQYYEIIISHL